MRKFLFTLMLCGFVSAWYFMVFTSCSSCSTDKTTAPADTVIVDTVNVDTTICDSVVCDSDSVYTDSLMNK